MANTIKNIKVLETYPEINYTLIKRDTTFQSFVACWHFNDEDPNNIYWSAGHYFETIREAIHYIDKVYANSEEEVAEYWAARGFGI